MPLLSDPAALAVDTPETITVHSRRVACQGAGGTLGHPRVWLEMGESDVVECPYCDRRFVWMAGDSHAPSVPGVIIGHDH